MLPGQTHFYPAEAKLADSEQTLEAAISEFLKENL